MKAKSISLYRNTVTWSFSTRFIQNPARITAANACYPWTDSPKDPSRKVEDDTIIFTDVQTGSSAVYQCNVSNDYGYLLSNAFVNVLCKFLFTRSICIGTLFSIYIDFWRVITWQWLLLRLCSGAAQSADTSQQSLPGHQESPGPDRLRFLWVTHP